MPPCFHLPSQLMLVNAFRMGGKRFVSRSVSASFSFAWLSFARLSLVPVEGVLPEEADEEIAFICSNCLFVATNFVAKFHGVDGGANGYREGFACTFFSSVAARNSFSSSLMRSAISKSSFCGGSTLLSFFSGSLVFFALWFFFF